MAAITKKLTPAQRAFAQLVAAGLHSDIQAYMLSHRCKEDNAHKNAWRCRKLPQVDSEIRRLVAAQFKAQEQFLDMGTVRGRLANIILHGKDSDSIRAIGMLAAVDKEQRELGAGVGSKSEFDELLEEITKRPRLLPCDDPEDDIPIDA